MKVDMEREEERRTKKNFTIHVRRAYHSLGEKALTQPLEKAFLLLMLSSTTVSAVPT